MIHVYVLPLHHAVCAGKMTHSSNTASTRGRFPVPHVGSPRTKRVLGRTGRGALICAPAMGFQREASNARVVLLRRYFAAWMSILSCDCWASPARLAPDARCRVKPGNQLMANHSHVSSQPLANPIMGLYRKSFSAASILNHRCIVSTRTLKGFSFSFRPIAHV